MIGRLNVVIVANRFRRDYHNVEFDLETASPPANQTARERGE